MLTELEEKYLQSFGNVKAMERTWILRRALELKFKGNRVQKKMVLPGTGIHQQVKERLARTQEGKLVKRRDETGDFLSVDPYKTEMTRKEDRCVFSDQQHAARCGQHTTRGLC